MRAMFDANVLISMLLSPKGAVGIILQEIQSGSIQLLICAQTLDEVRYSCREKPYLAERIHGNHLDRFLESIVAVSQLLPRLDPPFEPYTRDPNDDYLVAHDLAEHVDVLVSGDRHLLNEKGRFTFLILSPAEFVVTYLLDTLEP